MELQESLPKIEAAGLQLVAVSYDSVDTLKEFADARGIGFPLLSDADSKTIDAYGIRNLEAQGRQAGIPYPGFFVVDPDGRVRARLFYQGYVPRHDPDELIAVASGPRE